jgi:hypothetical protein
MEPRAIDLQRSCGVPAIALRCTRTCPAPTELRRRGPRPAAPMYLPYTGHRPPRTGALFAPESSAGSAGVRARGPGLGERHGLERASALEVHLRYTAYGEGACLRYSLSPSAACCRDSASCQFCAGFLSPGCLEFRCCGAAKFAVFFGRDNSLGPAAVGMSCLCCPRYRC